MFRHGDRTSGCGSENNSQIDVLDRDFIGTSLAEQSKIDVSIEASISMPLGKNGILTYVLFEVLPTV